MRSGSASKERIWTRCIPMKARRWAQARVRIPPTCCWRAWPTACRPACCSPCASSGPIRTEILASKARNENGLWRIPRAEVAIHLSEPAAGLERFDRVLAQFEEFCIVTQSVREGMQVDVRIVDADGAEYVPGGAGETA